MKSRSSRVETSVPYCFDPCRCRVTVRWFHLDFGSGVIPAKLNKWVSGDVSGFRPNFACGWVLVKEITTKNFSRKSLYVFILYQFEDITQ